ncbi:MAG: hypothetical protein JWM98_475 [Thermoleophilia bacterium]|nr:hypothetical protein [Thermoleophilia bacterium]
MIALVAAQPTVPPTTPTLAEQFTAIAADLGRTDEVLTKMSANGNTPTAAWAGHMDTLASRISDARDGLRDLRRDQADLASRLGEDMRSVAGAGGALAEKAQQLTKLTGEWGTLLDGPIADALEAAKLLGGGVNPPVPAPVPTPKPVPTPTPKPGAGATLDRATRSDVEAAVALIRQSVDTIRTVPASDTGSEATKAARIGAFHLNLDAQAKLEPHFTGGDAKVTSELRRADASLEDAAWQLAKKPSPDGRFNGVDVPGALRDTQAAADILTALAA